MSAGASVSGALMWWFMIEVGTVSTCECQEGNLPPLLLDRKERRLQWKEEEKEMQN